MSSKGGDVEYTLVVNDGELSADLERANKKVEKSAKGSADNSVKIEKEKTQDIKKEFVKVEDSAKKTADKAEKSWKESADSISDNFKETADEVEKSTDDCGSAVENIASAIKGSFADAAEGTVPLIGKIGELTTGLSKGATFALGIGTAFAGAGVLSVGVANDMTTAMNDFLAETGKSAEETERYQGILENIYANNYGDNFQDIADALAETRKQIGPVVDAWDDAAIQEFTESAFTLRDTFEYDVSESVRAANTLMEQFGVDGQYAFGLIAAGAQNGLDFSGEMLDSINEYSVQFQKMGLDADDMFKIFRKGADTGAFNLDKIGDAVKEMSIRVVDGSDTTREGFKLIGLDADEMAAKFAAGGDTAKEAFNETIDALAAMEDPLEQNTAGVDLFGTMWEDLGPEAVTALSDIEDGVYNTSDALNSIKEVKYDDLNSMFEDLKRNVELLVIPIGETLIPLLGMLIESILPILTGLLGPLIDLFAALLVPIISVISAGIEPLIEILNFLTTHAIQPLISVISAILVPLFSGSLNSMFSTANSVINNIINIFKSLIDFIRNVFTGNWSAAWYNIRDIFSNAVSGLAAIFKAPLNAIVDGWNKLASSIGSVDVPEWVPVVGGGTFSLPQLPRLKVGLDYVPSDMFPAFLDEGEWVLTKEEASLLRRLGGIEGMLSMIKNPESMREVLIQDQQEIDYEAIGEAVYAALKLHGLGLSIGKREFGRIVEDALEEREHK